MKIKNKVLGFVTLAVLGMSTGCSDDFLRNKKNYGSYDEGIFEGENMMNWYIDYVNFCYFATYKSPVLTKVGEYSDVYTKSTEEIGGTITDYINPGVNLTKDKCPNYYGTKMTASVANNAYSRIRQCNYLLQYIDELGTNLTDEFRTYAKGQMLFLRGLQYFDLVRTYGGVPLVLEVQDPKAEDNSIKLPRAKTSDCIKQICQDFDDAAKMLPSQWANASADFGRFTRGAALAMKSRVLLYWASPLFNRNMDENRWQAALTASLEAETQLKADGYGLYGLDNPGTNGSTWNEMFLVDHQFCEEAIIVQLCSNYSSSGNTHNNSWENSIRPESQGGGGGVKAPKEMIDLFPMANGSRPTVTNGYNPERFFLNRDPRFYRTFAFSGCKWPYYEDEESVVWTYGWVTKEASGEESISYEYADGNDVNSPALVRKMSAGAKTNKNGLKYSGTDIFEYRYAELVLNIAECYAATNNMAKCVEYLSMIRKRAGLPAANNYGLGSLGGKYEAIAACLYERQVELAYEGKRFWDIQRWMLYNDDASENNTTCADLGVEPLNGTCRTGNRVIAKNYVGEDDPLMDKRTNICVDPDEDDFHDQLTQLDQFFDDLEYVAPETPMDSDNKKPVNIDWKQKNYIFGLNHSTMSANTWLQQNKGWDDLYGGAGTFDPLL